MEPSSEEEAWVQRMYQTTTPRIIDASNLAGFDRHRGRAAMLAYTISQLLVKISEHGLSSAIHWIVDRHPREVAMMILFVTTMHSLPEDIPDVVIWSYASLREMMRCAYQIFTRNHHTGTRPTETLLTVGIIPDGNRRWGKNMGVGPNNGHFYGSSRVMECVRAAIIDGRIGNLVIYVMSYDNIQKRSPKEQRSLLAILRGWVSELMWLDRLNLARVRVCGEPSETVQTYLTGIPINPIDDPAEALEQPRPMRVTLLIGYDGRREIQQARGDPARMWLREDLDGVIRTGGTRRASGFCTYQTGYSEWFYTDRMWPDITSSIFYEYITKIEKSVGLQNHGR